MNTSIAIAAILALIGSAAVGGIFFAFSNFIMKALARLPYSEGMAAMQSINVVVLNPAFLGLFAGTAILSLLMIIIAVFGWDYSYAPYYLIGGLFYIVGTFLVTGIGNVPLNNHLASIEPTDTDANAIWEQYLKKWTRLNSIRTICALAASTIFIIGLI